MRSTMGSLLSAPIWSRVAARPVGELRERAAELAFQASDVGAVADALEPLQHQRGILAVLPDLFDWRLRERNRPTQRLRQDLRRLRHRSYVTGEIDLAAGQSGRGRGSARARASGVVRRHHPQLPGPTQRRRPLALRLARQAAQTEPAALQRLRDRAALIACYSGDENRSIVRHDVYSFTRRTIFPRV